MSLERSTSFTRRRYSRQDLNFSQANSLTSVLVRPALRGPPILRNMLRSVLAAT